jgi:hypothetical protein
MKTKGIIIGRCNGCNKNFGSCTCNIPEPDFDKLWEKIQERISYPTFYMIEKKGTEEWLAKSGYVTKSPYLAMKIEGKDAKAMANLFLALNQSKGFLLNFHVTEHMFTEK